VIGSRDDLDDLDLMILKNLQQSTSPVENPY